MRKLLILLLLPLLFLGCADSDSEIPVMKIVGVFMGGDEEETNYANKFSELPDLQVGDEVDIVFTLNGNGDDLKSFIVVNDNAAIKTIMFFLGDEISLEFSELNEGKAVFVDGVNDTWVTVKAKIVAPITEEQVLSFHLFSKAPEGAKAQLTFRASQSNK
ncbi:DUF5035 family protein [Bacteroides sp. 519]|uniref:DUF5035 family protein n=1 Tax=Bacteroides sp. 519 TaxID=2302937 RepID=UPI0013D7B24F|nr:DUF5035 family protein [Bacteroides sp. 519]NDV59218.1 DUF5035 domain-containing protein [Bacteroides sp. 519]